MVDVSIHYVATLRRRPRYPKQFTCLCFSVLMFEMLGICKVCMQGIKIPTREVQQKELPSTYPKHLSASYNQL